MSCFHTDDKNLLSDISFYDIETLQLPTVGSLPPQETKFEANLMLSIKGELNIGGISHDMGTRSFSSVGPFATAYEYFHSLDVEIVK